LLTEKALKRGSHPSIAPLRQAILGYVDAHNENGQPFRWTKTADEILDKMFVAPVRSTRMFAPVCPHATCSPPGFPSARTR
jgi:hypothetical protein